MGAIQPFTTASGERRYVFGVVVPYLPDLLAEHGNYSTIGDPVAEAYGRQIALLRAITAFPARRCALQLRFLGGADASSKIAIALLGAAGDFSTAANLFDLLSAAKPPEIQFDEIDRDDVLQWLDPFPDQTFDATRLAEIRRAVQPIDPLVRGQGSSAYDEMVLPWSWTPQSLTHSLDILRSQQDMTMLAVHVEPRAVDPSIFEYLADCAKTLAREGQQGYGGELAQFGYQVCQQRASSLRQAALHLRVVVASRSSLLPGTAEYLGADLTRSTDQSGSLPQAFQVIRPRTRAESEAAGRMLRSVSAVDWGLDGLDPQLAELMFLVDPVEANCAFRIPVTPRGGLPGISTRAAEIPSGVVESRDRQGNGTGPPMPLGTGPSVGEFAFSSDDLNEHLLVAGVPGAGKSTTVRSILLRLPDTVPFLVLDPAKTDYSALSGVANVYRLGLDRVAFNPLVVPEGASVIGHASRVLAAFDNAFRFSEVFPLARPLLGLALRAAYRSTRTSDLARADTPWPTIADLYRHVRAVIAEQGFAGEAVANLKGSLLSRIEFLIDGGLGVSLAGDRRDGIRWAELMAENSVVELRAFSSPEDRSLLFGLLFSGLVGWREAHPEQGLAHVTVLEEAHRLLRASASGSFAASLFADAIAELRGAGEGFIIVDQAPSSLISEASKNTGTKIAHRLLDRDERDYMGDAMVLAPAQKADLARLPHGRVFVLSGSIPDPVVVDVERAEVPPDDPDNFRYSFVARPRVRRAWCRHCPDPCNGASALGWQRQMAAILRKGDGSVADGQIVPWLMQAVAASFPRASAVERFCAVAHTLSLLSSDGAVLDARLSSHARLVRAEAARQAAMVGS